MDEAAVIGYYESGGELSFLESPRVGRHVQYVYYVSNDSDVWRAAREVPNSE
jgi:hypothetical protein